LTVAETSKKLYPPARAACPIESFPPGRAAKSEREGVCVAKIQVFSS